MSLNATAPFSGEEIAVWASVLLVCLYAISTVSGLCGSGLIIFTLVSDNQFRQVSCTYTVYLSNLVVTDLFVQLYYFPLLAVGLLTGRHPVVDDVHCVVNGFLFFVCSIVFMFTLAAISLDRYMCVCHRLAYLQYFSRRNSRIVVVVMWVASCLVCLPSALDGSLGFDSKIHMCFLRDRGTFTLGHAVTVGVVTVTTAAVGIPNALIYWTYYVHRRRVGQSMADNTETQKSVSQTPLQITYSNSALTNNSNVQDSTPQVLHKGNSAGAQKVAFPASPEVNHNHSGLGPEGPSSPTGSNVTHSLVHDLRQPLTQDSDQLVVRNVNETDDDADYIESVTTSEGFVQTLTVVEGFGQTISPAKGSKRTMSVAEYVSQNKAASKERLKSLTVAQDSYQELSQRSPRAAVQNSNSTQNAEDSVRTMCRNSNQSAAQNCTEVRDQCRIQTNGHESRQISDQDCNQTATGSSSVSEDSNQMVGEGSDQPTVQNSIRATASQTANQDSVPETTVNSTHSGGRRAVVSRSDIALMRSLLSIFLVFFLLTIPATVAFMIRSLVYISPVLYCLLVWLYAVNTSVNWIIYGVMNSRFRLGYKRALNKLKSCFGRT